MEPETLQLGDRLLLEDGTEVDILGRWEDDQTLLAVWPDGTEAHLTPELLALAQRVEG
ncbi:MAG TPA: hypothetical protein VN524_10665 [Hyphomicrobiaceae bacterium]|nr:hypothetical protein [Hyphomicrobiaceae bacterium]